MDNDRSLIPKPRDLLDLPKEIMEDVIKNLPPIDRLIFRKTCKPIRNIVSRMNPGFTRIHVTIQEYESTLCLDDRPSMRHDEPLNHKIDYKEVGNIMSYQVCNIELNGHPRSKVSGEWPETLALGDLFVLLENPRLALEELSIDYSLGSSTFIRDQFKQLTHKIKVSRFKTTINSFLEERDILPYLDSTVIREIELDMVDGESGENWTVGTRKDQMQRLVEMDTWKAAEWKTLHLRYNVLFPVELFLDCKKLTIYLEFKSRSMDPVIKWMKALLSSPVLQQASIRTNFQLKPKQLFGRDVINQDGRRHFPIPGTNEVFELSILVCLESEHLYSELYIERRLNWLI